MNQSHLSNLLHSNSIDNGLDPDYIENEGNLIFENQQLLKEISKKNDDILSLESKLRIQTEKCKKYKQSSESSFKNLSEKTRQYERVKEKYKKLVEKEDKRREIVEENGDCGERCRQIEERYVKIKTNVGEVLNYIQEIGMDVDDITEITNILLKR